MKTLQRFGTAFSMCIVLGAVALAQATFPYYEPFDYPAGDTLLTKPNWAGLNSGDTLVIAAGNLSHPGFAASVGNKVAWAGAGQEGAASFTLTATGTVYYSYLLKVASVGSLDSNGGYFTTFYQSPTSSTGGSCVWTRLDGAAFDIGVSTRISSPVSWSSVKSLDSTYLIVASYEFVSGVNNDVCKIWINPDVSTFGAGAPPPETLTSTNNTTDLTGVARVQLRQDSDTKTPFIELDELRVDTTWAGVVPAGGATAVNDPAPGLAPRELRLQQNYPNPFNPTTNLTFTVPSNGRATLRVFNALGQEVATLFNGEVQAGNYTTVSFDARGLASGTYFSRLEHNGSVQSKIMLLMK